MSASDYARSQQGEGLCPRCGAGRLRAWYELSREEREVVRRLPAAADFPLDERRARSRWCTRCWYEETLGAPRET